MKSCHQRKKTNFLTKLQSKQGIFFHLAGLVAIIWFLIRVVPRPDRIRYPCQQMGISMAFGYIIFWSVLWGSLFHGLGHLTKKLKNKTIVVAPVFLVSLIMIFSVSSTLFADNIVIKKDDEVEILSLWDPIPNEPIGTPLGVNPGRVTWVWNPNATEEELTGYWWYKENNNQTVIDQMYSDGLQQLAGVNNDYDAWDILFHYFNIEHGKGDVGYQSGEKIAIKINMNNGYYDPYTSEYDDIDANPYVVKALLRQLCDVVGIAEEDITVYDASRRLMNWFYNRVYYEEYPADPLVPEFPDVHYVDMDGAAEGREQVVASDKCVYFAAGSCAYRTLPTVVTEADYMINMPITKRHVGERVTLAGKNWFGTWMEAVYPIHNYHTMGYSQMGNPAPQVDLVADERLGGNTLLLIGDGTYACRYGNSDISKFDMYPFNVDWMSSLFFSQDSVALDSVMFDFFMAEGTGGGPSEGAQNYLHQAADPPADLYDPEGDGTYLSESLGVHEHWDTNEDIFSPERYSGPSNNGIDYIAIFTVDSSVFSSMMYQGWNLITVPIPTTWTAETLGQNISGCTVVSMFNGGSQSFISHVVGTPHDDFPIMDGVGYFVYVTSDSILSLRDSPISSVNVSVHVDWNLIGWYHDYSTTAESLGQNISECSVVIMFNATSQTFLTHVVGVPHDNFTIERGIGLFIYTDEASYWHGEG